MKSNDFARAAVAAAVGGRERTYDSIFNLISLFQRDRIERASSARDARVAATTSALPRRPRRSRHDRARARVDDGVQPRASCATFRATRVTARARHRAIGARKIVATLDGCRPR
jgi:hypothetical protein